MHDPSLIGRKLTSQDETAIPIRKIGNPEWPSVPGYLRVWHFLRSKIPSVISMGLFLGWLSTCLTSVPLGSHGVLVSFGRYETPVLESGLHFSLPWPVGEIVIVETERLREISLGYDRDMGGPILWTKPHHTGDKNLLVDNGESLLTIDVPILYRVTDAVSFLKSTSDASAALKSLATRKLTHAVRSHESFQIMTVDREQIAAELKKALQEEIDRMGLGLEIVFVGLKDAHPPIDVTPAYEQVVSAQEAKEASIYQARAYESSVLPAANAEAYRHVIEADAAKTERIDDAIGKASRFSALVTAEQENPALFRTRLKYEALDETLVAPTKIIVDNSNRNSMAIDLDLRSTGSAAAPIQKFPQEKTRDRVDPREAPER